MTCEGCSALVQKAVEGVPGVLSVQVDYEGKRAVVTSEACCPDPAGQIVRRLQAKGYQAGIVEP